jgi:hypothetical protein
MRVANSTMVLILAVAMGLPLYGQRSLNQAEIGEIVEELTRMGRQTWIPAGTIEGRHQQYRAPRTTDSALVDRSIEQAVSKHQNTPDKAEEAAQFQKMVLDAIPFNVEYELANESSMTTSEIVRYDGERFYWEVSVSSRSDSVTPSADLFGNYAVNYFNRNWNDRRIFAWDGQEYTIYAVSAGGAIVDAAYKLPRTVTGPLTAGITAWGHGPLAYPSLLGAKISATEILRDGITQIDMTIEPGDGSSMSFVLDPSKDFATLSAKISGGSMVAFTTCSGYRNVGGCWVPRGVLIEQYDAFTSRLLRSDKWDLGTVSTAVPDSEKLDISFGADTVVEYYSPLSSKASIYHYSNAVDADLLLAERLAYAAGEGSRSQNCATASLRYAATQMGKTPTASDLAQMIGADGQTTMYDLKQCAERLGLYCRAVQTDVATLETLSACKAILHIPAQDHFVVLDQIDGRYAWIVDLSSGNFYSRRDKAFLAGDWTDGIALLVSDQPVKGQFADVPDAILYTVAGGEGYSCTALLQSEDIVPCEDGGGDSCYGYFQWYFERWGCETAPSGSCTLESLARMAGSDCYTDPIEGCLVTGIWDWYGMSACK